MDLTQEQIDAIEGIIKRRMTNTGESRAEACDHIRNFLLNDYGSDQGTTSGCPCCG